MDLEDGDRNVRARVLAVDDEPDNLELLERTLRRHYDVLTATSPSEALALLERGEDVAAIVSDYRMPEMTGAEFLAASMRTHPHARRVIVTGYSEAEHAIAAINSGRIHHFIRKPWDRGELLDVLARLLEAYELESQRRALLDRLEHDNAGLREREADLVKQLDDQNHELREANRELDTVRGSLETLSYQDTLTGLYNHRTFRERLETELARVRAEGRSLAILLGDIDHFSAVNSELGHASGDEVLQSVASLLATGERGPAIAGRYGGEEFGVLLPGTSKDEAAFRANRLRAQVAGGSFAGGRALTASFGVAAYPDDAGDVEALIQAAEGALWAAKRSGRNRVHLYQDDGSCPPPRSGNGWFPNGRGDGDDPLPAERQFPTYHDRLAMIASALERDRALSCLYIDLSGLRRIEIEHGVAKHTEITERVGSLLDGVRGERLRKDDLICCAQDGGAYICFLAPSRTRAATPASDLEGVAARVEDLVECGLADDVRALVRQRPRLPVGFSRVLNNPMLRPERLVSRLIEEARQSAELHRKRSTQNDKTRLQEIILHEQLTPVYQPIIHLESAEVFGHESLTRGPSGTPLESPGALFSVADEVDLTFELDRACFRGALRGAVGLEPVHRLFVNLLPLSFYDPYFIESEVSKLLAAAGLTPTNVVFEITEKLAIENFNSFRRALATYTSMGFGVAIDDVGTRHSNLETVMALRPDFIKISDVLTRGVSRSTVKREMLRSLGRIAETIDAVVVAEGIETPDDLAVLCDLGVHYGQGFFLGRPAPAFPRFKPAIKRTVRALARTPSGRIPAPPADLEDDGERHEQADRAIRQAVLDRANESGVLEKPDGEALVRALMLERGDPPAAADAPTEVSGDAPPRDELRSRADVVPLKASEWRPLSDEELGGARTPERESKLSLMDSLRHGERAAGEDVDEEPTSGGTVYP